MIFNIIGVADYRLRFALKARVKRQKKKHTSIQAKNGVKKLFFTKITPYFAWFEALASTNKALEAKISDLKSKQGVGLPKIRLTI